MFSLCPYLDLHNVGINILNCKEGRVYGSFDLRCCQRGILPEF